MSKRDQLIDTALEMFYRQGFNATGIDKILAEARVAKMTLYKHFRSKDELIEAALKRRDERFRDWLSGYVEKHTATPREQLLALFDAYRKWFSRAEFRGCMFLNASAEFAGIDQTICGVAATHMQLTHAYIRGLAAGAGAHHPDQLADELTLLLEGAVGCAQISSDPTWAERAKRAAVVLIDAHLPETAGAIDD